MKKRTSKFMLAAVFAAALAASAAMAGPEATAEPTAEPPAAVTAEPTAELTVEPTEEPSEEPTAEPTEEPSPEPTKEPAQAEPVAMDEPAGADVPMLTAYVNAKGRGTADDPYLIENADQMNELRQTGAGAGVYFKLMNNINLNEASPGRGPFFEVARAFNGTFDGDGHTITYSFTVDGLNKRGYMGLFWSIGESGTVKNVNIAADSTITVKGSLNGSGVGGIAAENNGLIENCESSIKFSLEYAESGFNVTGGAARYLGGIAGTNKGTIRGCTSACSLEIQEISKDYNASYTITAPSADNVGGIAGLNEGRIEGCTYTGSLSGAEAVGGIVGSNGGGSSSSTGVIADCTNTGAITESFKKDQYIGGIAGSNKRGSTVTGCHNKGAVSQSAGSSGNTEIARHCIGGIVGISESESTITRCYNTGKVDIPAIPHSTSTPAVGGIAGRIEQKTSIITDCYNTAKIAVINAAVGGIVGDNYYGTVENCYNNGSVRIESLGRAGGGIMGEDSRGTAVNCYHLDTNDGIGQEKKTAAAFGSGEVAWLLQAGREEPIWGQTLGTDGYPLLTGEAEKAVYKVTFETKENKSYAVMYTNPAGLAELPPDPEVSEHTFDHWASDPSTGEAFTANTPVDGDMTVYAVEKALFGGEADRIERTVSYGAGLQEDLSAHVQYSNADPTAGKFTYTITAGNEALNASIQGDILTVPQDAKAGSYALAVRAEETKPQYSLISIGPFGKEPVTLTVRVTIEKIPASGAAAGKLGLVYTGAAQQLVEVTEPAVGGELLFSTAEAGEYGPAIPAGADAGDYTVWYKVVGDENHTDTEAKELTIAIAKATPVCAVTMADYTCMQTDVEPAVTSDTEGAAVAITYAEKGAGDFTDQKPQTAGEYTVRAVFRWDDNYNEVTAEADFRITHQFNAGWEQEGDGYRHDCPCGTGLLLEVDGLTQVPEGLKDVPEADTVEKIERLLAEQTDTGEDYTLYDVKLETLVDGAWVEVTAENFPAEGVEVTLPYPEGTNAKYAFTVVHMFTAEHDRHMPGETETLRTKNGADGIRFTVKSLSPICVGWRAPKADNAKAPDHRAPDTGDGTAALPYALALCLCGAALTGLLRRRRRS